MHMAIALLGFVSVAQDLQHRQLAASVTKWEQLQQVNGDSYTYVASATRESQSIFEDTEITVEDGMVVGRRYTAHGDVGRFQWNETQDLIGSHADGAPPETMEALYEKCRTDILSLDPMAYWITLRFDQEGLLQQCLYFARNATDPEGINLLWVRFTP